MDPGGSTVLFRRSKRSLPRKEITSFAQRLTTEVTGGRPFTCLVTDDAELLRLNSDFLNNPYPTDVLSFPSGQPEGDLGELAISSERAIAQAEEFGHTPGEEVRILMLHGVLHLLGMDHETDRGKMARVERRWRERLELPQSLLERARA
ncbi:MAG TPA: rRNA maturation RNase YbeY [Bryobacteraceae bacterium]|nr:rRNA maturation RNase YbeY [Bryobacteraceae bacterium]